MCAWVFNYYRRNNNDYSLNYHSVVYENNGGVYRAAFSDLKTELYCLAAAACSQKCKHTSDIR